MVGRWNKCSKAATLTRKEYHLTQREKDKNNEKTYTLTSTYLFPFRGLSSNQDSNRKTIPGVAHKRKSVP